MVAVSPKKSAALHEPTVPTVVANRQPAGMERLLCYLPKGWPVMLLSLLAAPVLLWRLSDGTLLDWDEAIYAQISKEMVESGNWLTPQWGYENWFHKPPLLMWATAIFYTMFGVNELWARATSALCGIALVIVTYLIAKSVYDKSVGFAAALVLLTSYGFVSQSRFGTMDVALSLTIFLTVYAYIRLRESGEQRWWYAVWATCALALMVKGAAGVVAPGVIALALLLGKETGVAIRSRYFWQGCLLAVAIVAPWHLYMCWQHGQSFISEYVGFHLVARSTTALEGHRGDRFYYIENLRLLFTPWFYLVPFALALSIKEHIEGEVRARPVVLVAALVFVMYTLVRTKLPWYIVPLYPALAILVAPVLVQAFRSHTSLARSGFIIATIMVVLLAPLKLVLLLGGIGAGGVFYSVVRNKHHQAWQVAMIAMCALWFSVGLLSLQPLYTKGEEPVAKLARLTASTGPDDRAALIVFSRTHIHPTPLYYSNRPTRYAATLAELTNLIGDRQKTRVILDKENVQLLSEIYQVDVVAEAEPFVYATINQAAVQ